MTSPPVVEAAFGRPDVAWKRQPHRRYLLVMIVVHCVAHLVPPWLDGLTGAADSPLGRASCSKTISLLVAAVVAVVLVRGLRVTPRDAYLAPGNMAAPSGIRLPGTPRKVSWAVLGPLPAGALFALLATMATLVGVVSSGQAVPLTSVWSGCTHHFAPVPEGFGGVVQSGALALMLGGAMVATKGLGRPFLSTSRSTSSSSRRSPS